MILVKDNNILGSDKREIWSEYNDLRGVTWLQSADPDSNYCFATHCIAENPAWFQRQLLSTLKTMPEDRGEAQERVEPMEEEDGVGGGEAEEEGEAEVEVEAEGAEEEEDVEVTEDEAAELAGLNR